MKRTVLLAVGTTVVIVGVVAGFRWQPWVAELPDDAAFAIGEDVVTVADLDQRNQSLEALYGVQEPLADEERDTFLRQSAKSMAISLVLDRAVDDAAIDVPDEDVQSAFAGFLEAQFAGDRNAFIDALGNVNSSERAVLDEIERQLALRLLLAEVASDVEVTDAELRDAFAERRAELDTPQKRVVNNIVVSTRAEAVSARRKLDAGADVAVLARRVSIDAATRDKGGALGALARTDLLPAVGAAVFDAPSGAAYGPVRGPHGWNVGVVARVIPAVPATFARARDELRATLEAELAQSLWAEWLDEEIRDADIEYADEYRPSDPFDVTAWADPSAGGGIQEDQ